METHSLEVYSRDSNFAIIKPPGRYYPGSVIQGDTLSNLCQTVRRLANSAKMGSVVDQDMVDNIEDLNNALIDRVLHYQHILAEHEIELPFQPPFSVDDLITDPER